VRNSVNGIVIAKEETDKNDRGYIRVNRVRLGDSNKRQALGEVFLLFEKLNSDPFGGTGLPVKRSSL
jgi:hypothetical protein